MANAGCPSLRRSYQKVVGLPHNLGTTPPVNLPVITEANGNVGQSWDNVFGDERLTKKCIPSIHGVDGPEELCRMHEGSRRKFLPDKQECVKHQAFAALY